MTDKPYFIVTINDRQYHVAPECALMLEAICRDERYQQMFAIPFGWLELTISQKRESDGRGGSIRVKVAGG